MAGETLTDILRRVSGLEGGNLPPSEVAEQLLKLNFGRADRRRMRDFFHRCNEGELTPEEEKEYEAYTELGLFLTWLHAKSRMALKARPSADAAGAATAARAGASPGRVPAAQGKSIATRNEPIATGSAA